ncbi:MAG: diacylglycerol kinase [Magnetococcales bacterium]|nr:diacylglycerol kinase [Magnetococcales bacterium]
MKPGATGLTRVIDAAGYSWAGLRAAWRHEAAFRQEAALALALIPLGFWLGNGALERGMLVGSLLLVLVIELLNSGIEAVVDRIGPEHHPLAGRAKDLGSAAVLIGLLIVALVWGLILWERLF